MASGRVSAETRGGSPAPPAGPGRRDADAPWGDAGVRAPAAAPGRTARAARHPRVPALEHGLRVLERLAAEGPAKVPDLVSRLGVARSSLYNILGTLADHGFVTVQRGTVSLGARVLHLAGAVLASLDLRHVAKPAMEQLVAATEETANVGVLSGSEVVYIDIVSTPLPVKLSSEVGRTCPAHCTALGKVLLAWATPEAFARITAQIAWTRYTPRTIGGPEELARACAQVRQRGWALDDQEFDDGVRCLAVPLRDHTGAVKAALSLSGPEYRLPERRWPELLHALRQAQASIEAGLGWSGGAREASAGDEAVPATRESPPRVAERAGDG